MSSTDGEDEMKTMTDKATYESLQKDVEAVKNDISTLAGQITDALNTLADSTQKQAKRSYRQARSNVDAAMSDIGKRGSEALDAAQDVAITMEESLEDAITQRPLAAIGLALGLGFLIGVTWRR